jgi:radical SAM superfamily enzyme YgiQ (UPF0313 family)
MIFLSNILLSEEIDTPNWEFTYTPRVVDQVLELCQGSRLIGISVMTNYHHSMGHLTDQIISRLEIPVVWGGIHPTLRPEACLEHADFACLGEGEGALLDLATALREGRAVDTIDNICFKREGRIVRPDIRPLIQDLDQLPFQDYDLDEHYLLRREEQRIVQMNPDLLEVYLDYGPRSLRRSQPTFQIMIARGCPYRCTFCGNQALAALYPEQRYLRRRSNEHAIAEIKAFKERYPFVKAVLFSDDSFVLADDENIREFCERYARDVDLPFRCMATPRSVTPKKMQYLTEAGLFFMEVGIQTGSERINELYQRRWSSRETVLNAVSIINQYKDRVMPLYDVILDNPFATPDDEMDTLRLILQLPKPYVLQIFSLTLFPGTKLLEEALASGLVTDERELYQKDYRLFRRNYINVLYVLLCRGVPPLMVRFLTHRAFLSLLDRPYFEQLFNALVAVKDWWRRAIGRIRVAIRWHRRLRAQGQP